MSDWDLHYDHKNKSLKIYQEKYIQKLTEHFDILLTTNLPKTPLLYDKQLSDLSTDLCMDMCAGMCIDACLCAQVHMLTCVRTCVRTFVQTYL